MSLAAERAWQGGVHSVTGQECGLCEGEGGRDFWGSWVTVAAITAWCPFPG